MKETRGIEVAISYSGKYLQSAVDHDYIYNMLIEAIRKDKRYPKRWKSDRQYYFILKMEEWDYGPE